MAFARALREAAVWLMGGLAALAAGVAAEAEPLSFFTVEGVSYDPSVETPEAAFGHELGERPVRFDPMMSYLARLGEASDRMQVSTIGRSHEGRPILHFVISAPDNLARIEEIRTAHLAAIDPEVDGPAPADDAPVVVWLNYGVHGAEASAMDAAVPVLYHLAAAQGPEIDAMLAETVILVTAVFNPDGHARRIDHVLAFGGEVPVTNPDHQQHQLWIAARTNHYWFDLNRQWLLVTQPEARAWLAQWRRWSPHVSADFHEMGSEGTYYFHPGEPRRRNPLIPDAARDMAFSIAERHADYLDGERALYYTEEGFDNFYVGKGSTYPQINGGVGILFEAGSARGGLIESSNGERDYAVNIRTHFRTSLTTIDGARALRGELLAYQRDFFDEALRLGREDETRAYVFTARDDPARTFHFLELLEMHGIDAFVLARDITVNGRDYARGEAYVVPMAQAQYRMIRAVFDRVTEFEEEVFYDVSGWTLPLAYDLDHDALEGRVFFQALIGPRAVASFPRAAPPPRASYGYVFDWTSYYAPRALERVLAAGLRARAATRPFTARTVEGTADFGRGAVFVPLGGQDMDEDEILALMAEIAQQDGVEVHAVASGLTATPGVDLGAGVSFRPVARPQVLLAYNDGASRYDAGEVWHLLDHRMGAPVTLRHADELLNLDWSRYTHLVLPGLNGGGGQLDPETAARVRRWVREDGGIVIATRHAAAWAQETLLADPVETAAGGGGAGLAAPPAKAEDEEEEDTLARYDYSEMRVRDAEHVIGGALMAGDLDVSHPLGFGFVDRALAVHRNTTIRLRRPEDDPFAVVLEYADAPLLSGYASPQRLEEIAGEPAVVAHRRGAGAVIVFADNPVFRGTMFGASRMFLNAVYYGALIDAPGGDYVQEDRPPREAR